MQPDSWSALPNQSTFSLKVSGSTANCDAQAFVYMEDKLFSVWSHAELVAGKTLTLSVPHWYRVDLRISYNATANLTVDAGPQDAAGNALGTPYHEPSNGTTNDHDKAEFTLLTAA